MEQTSWNRLESLYYTALEIETGKLDTFLARVRRLTPDLYPELCDLLACTRESEDLLEEPLLDQTGIWRIVDDALPGTSESGRAKTGHDSETNGHEAKQEPAPKLEPSELVGRYRIVKQIGQGGMGVVYLAAQETPFHREVALKLVYFEKKKINREMIDRFKWECQALASLSHNNIAQVYEAGETGSGIPFFTMEYIQGLPINEFCDRRRLSARERIRLFLQVNEGVMHAHRKGIIHRDLKPSNILVTLQNEKPVVKIIDFGIARTFRAGSGSATAFYSRSPLGTPTYMSPEQTFPGSTDLDVRADIYSLGAVLYELLTGFTIINPETFQKALFTEKIKMVRDGEIPPASRRFTNRSFPEVGELAVKRNSSPRALARAIRGDLDAILEKALQKDPENRYSVVNHFSEDLGRHLERRPVSAHHGGFLYRSGKFIRRNASSMAIGILFFLVLIGSLSVFWVNKSRTAKNQKQFATLFDWITAPDPHRQGPNVSYLEVVSNVEKNLENYLVGDPILDANLRFRLGHLNFNLGRLDQAEDYFRDVLSVREKRLGQENLLTLETMTMLAKTLAFQDELAESENYFKRVIRLKEQIYGNDSPERMSALADYALLCNIRGNPAEAEQICNLVIPVLAKYRGEEDPETLTARGYLGEALTARRKYTLARQTFEGLLEVWEKNFGFNHFRTLIAAHNLGESILPTNPREAERIFRRVNRARLELLGEEKSWTLNTQNSLAFALYLQKRFDEAEVLARQVLRMRKKILPRNHQATLQTKNNLTLILEASGKLEEALAMLWELDAVYAEKYDTPTREGLKVKNNIGNVLNSLARYEEAMPVLEETLDKKGALLGLTDTSTLATMVTLGETYLYAGYFECAEQVLREAIAVHELNWPEEKWSLALYRGFLGECWSQMGDFKSAEEILLDSWNKLRGSADRRIIGGFIASLYDRWPQASSRP